AYLASPAVVAYSAIEGKIDYSWKDSSLNINGKIKSYNKKQEEKKKTKIINGFPEMIEGELLFCYQDNLNTDGIYPGKYTYVDDFTPQQQTGVVMENYDPEFKNIAKDGDILVGGYNFGTGSSREQAATALKYKGIRLLIAGSLNETYKRNALNNGFLLIECSDLVDDFKEKYDKQKLTVKTGITAKIDFTSSSMIVDNKAYSFDPVGAAAQELIVVGGLEEWVKKNISG
ncbi:MAG: homoaconitase, partial [Ignavibacteriaceae bacterium]